MICDDPAGTVVEQEPRGGTSVTKDAAITICISDGPEEVPNVEGLSGESPVSGVCVNAAP